MIKLLSDYEKALWLGVMGNAPVPEEDEDGEPLELAEQAQAAAEYADAVVLEYRKRV